MGSARLDQVACWLFAFAWQKTWKSCSTYTVKVCGSMRLGVGIAFAKSTKQKMQLVSLFKAFQVFQITVILTVTVTL